MAKRRSRRRSYGGRVARYTARARGFGGGKFGPAIQGVIAGLASQIGTSFLPGYGGALGLGAVGYFMNNPTLLTLAGVNASALIPISGLLGGGTSNGGSGAI